MPKRTNIEHAPCRKNSNGCPHCHAQPSMWQIDYEDGVTRFIVIHHGLNTSARQCPNISRFGLGASQDDALENWLVMCRDRLSQRITRSMTDRMFDNAQAEIELAIIPQAERSIGEVFATYGNLQQQLQKAMHRVINISDALYCVVYFDHAQHGVETKLLNKASNVPVQMLSTLSPDELVQYGQLQQRVQQWVQQGMSTAFPIATDEDAYAMYAKSATQQIAGQNADSSE